MSTPSREEQTKDEGPIANSKPINKGRPRKKKRQSNGTSQVQKVIKHIKDGITTGDFKSGDSIGENDIAGRLKMSRQPVREALAILENEGLVERKARLGSQVRSTPWEEVREILALRCVAECLIGYQLASLSPEEERSARLARLWQLQEQAKKHLKEAEEAEAQNDKEGVQEGAVKFTAGDTDFHAEMAEQAGFGLWKDISREFRHKVMIYHLRELPTVRHMKEIVAEHEAILTAIQGQTPKEVKEAIFSHIEGVADRYFKANTAYLASLRPVVGL